MTRVVAGARVTDDDMAAIQVRLAAYDVEGQRRADAYRMTFHWMLGWLDRDRQVSTVEIAVKMQEYFDQAIL